MQGQREFNRPDKHSNETISSDQAESSYSARRKHTSTWGISLDTQQRDTKFKELKKDIKELKKDIKKQKEDIKKLIPEREELIKSTIPEKHLAFLDPLMQRAQSLEENIIDVYINEKGNKQADQMMKDIKQSIEKLQKMRDTQLADKQIVEEQWNKKIAYIREELQIWINEEKNDMEDRNRHMIDQNVPDVLREREMSARKNVFDNQKKDLIAYINIKINKMEIPFGIFKRIDDYKRFKQLIIGSEIANMLEKEKIKIKQKMNEAIKQWVNEEKKSIEDHNRYMLDQNMPDDVIKQEMSLRLEVYNNYEKYLRTSMEKILNYDKSESEVIQRMEKVKEGYSEKKEDFIAIRRMNKTIQNWKDQMIEDVSNLPSEQDEHQEFDEWKYKQELDVRKILFYKQQEDLESYKNKMNEKRERGVLIEKKVNKRINGYNDQESAFIELGLKILAEGGEKSVIHKKFSIMIQERIELLMN